MISSVIQKKKLTIVTAFPMLVLLICTAGVVKAKTVTTVGSDAGTALLLSDSKIGKRVCYYNDKAYSLGSVISAEGVVLQCIAEQDFEMNGQLKWRLLKVDKD
ncbi:YnjH family protein [Vibrio sp. ZSDZ34]|jgi:hypothetical protein|uniref:YnjH family protein n=1 Tax=Vibrio gelatinilyticus TaxID=2893468 RepID=A0A9X1WBR0_9VIBR|nr:YnjH family protein [Vibrio gelatinilyticus]MCJ2376223.1 YnjH family protein [Vibrio gelatinilyticus]